MEKDPVVKFAGGFRISDLGFRISPKGFTLIELMVVVVISVLTISGGLAAYNNFNQKQKIARAGSDMYSLVRLAQSKAVSQETQSSGGCAAGKLAGYGVMYEEPPTQGVTGPSLSVKLLCETGQLEADGSKKYEYKDIGQRMLLPIGVKMEYDQPTICNQGVNFYILGGGAQDKKLCLSGFGKYYKVSVFTAGEVTDGGFVDRSAIYASTACADYCSTFGYRGRTCRRLTQNCRNNEVYTSYPTSCANNKPKCCCKL